MKNSLFLLLAIIAISLSTEVKSQNQPIINGVETFGNWDSIAAGEVPQYWDAFNREIIINGNNLGSIICVTKDSADPQDADYSVKISNQLILGNSMVPGILTTAKLDIDFMNQSGDASGGVPYSKKPAQLKGWYKFNYTTADTAQINVWLRKDTSDIAGGSLEIFSKKTVWTEFSVDIYYQPNITPDTMNIMFISSIAESNAPAGTILEIDHIWFTGGDLPINIAQEEVNNFKIFPNPASTMISIESPKSNMEYNINIYNSTGSLVNRVQTLQGTKEINISNLSSGIYFVEILYKNKRKMEKLIVK